MKKSILPLLIILAILAGILACSQSTSEEPLETSEAQLVPTDTVVPTVVPDPENTEAPVPTIAPTDIPEPTDAPLIQYNSLNDEGPFILYEGSSGVWVSNPDGSFLTHLTHMEAHTSIHRALSPDGDKLALVNYHDGGFDLVRFNLPDGSPLAYTQMFAIDEDEMWDADSDKAFVMYAIRDYPSAAWQPGGNLLAFMGGKNGPTSDLYVFDDEIMMSTQLTDGPAQGIEPIWTPDGQYILHFGVSWEPPFGGAIGGANTIKGSWSVDIETGDVITMPMPSWPRSNFLGWADDHTYFAEYMDDATNGTVVKKVDVRSGEVSDHIEFVFYGNLKMSPINHSIIFTNADDAPNGLGQGIFIFTGNGVGPTKLDDAYAWEFKWLPESKVFWAYPEALFTTNGATRYDPPVYDASFEPAISRKGYQAWEVIENQQGRVMVLVPGGEWETILEASIDALLWDPLDGSTLIMITSKGEVYTARFPDFEAELVGYMDGHGWNAIWVP